MEINEIELILKSIGEQEVPPLNPYFKQRFKARIEKDRPGYSPRWALAFSAAGVVAVLLLWEPTSPPVPPNAGHRPPAVRSLPAGAAPLRFSPRLADKQRERKVEEIASQFL